MKTQNNHSTYETLLTRFLSADPKYQKILSELKKQECLYQSLDLTPSARTVIESYIGTLEALHNTEMDISYLLSRILA